MEQNWAQISQPMETSWKQPMLRLRQDSSNRSVFKSEKWYDLARERMIGDSIIRRIASLGTMALLILLGVMIYVHTTMAVSGYYTMELHDYRWGSAFPRGALPSLNLYRYDNEANFPVFPQIGKPNGLLRHEMPQVDMENGDQIIKQKLAIYVTKQGGWVTYESIDLRTTQPFQSEVSGNIVFNHILPDIKSILEKNPVFFSRVILIRTSSILLGRNGVIPRGTLLTLDGHHTTATLRECAKSSSFYLRGMKASSDSPCGPNFSPINSVVVLNGIHPLEILKLAELSGAGFGQTLSLPAKGKLHPDM